MDATRNIGQAGKLIAQPYDGPLQVPGGNKGLAYIKQLGREQGRRTYRLFQQRAHITRPANGHVRIDAQQATRFARFGLAFKDFRQMAGRHQCQSQLFAGGEIGVIGQPFQDFWEFKGVQVFWIQFCLLKLLHKSGEDVRGIARYPEANRHIDKRQGIVRPRDQYRCV